MDIQFDVAVFAHSEGRTIRACVEALDRACEGRAARISVLLNGTTDDSIQVLQSLDLSHSVLQVYLIPELDKSNAINQFLYVIRHRSAGVHFFVDGYATVTPGALRALADALAVDKHAYIASGVPLTGRSASAVADEVRQGKGNVRGALFAMRPEFASRIVAERICLPLGLYRGDGLLGAMAKHDLSVPNTPWDVSRVIGVLAGTYTFRPLSPFRWNDIKRQYRRKIRIALGKIQNEMIREIVYQNGFSALPHHSREFVIRWLQKQPRSSLGFLRDGLFTHLAVRQGLAAGSPRALTPELVFQRAPRQGASLRG